MRQSFARHFAHGNFGDDTGNFRAEFIFSVAETLILKVSVNSV